MQTKDGILKILHKLKNDLMERYKVKKLWVFGSFVRQEQSKKSDIDLLVDFAEGASLFDLIGLGLFLEEKLGHKVDVVSKRALRKEIKDSVFKEMVAI